MWQYSMQGTPEYIFDDNDDTDDDDDDDVDNWWLSVCGIVCVDDIDDSMRWKFDILWYLIIGGT